MLIFERYSGHSRYDEEHCYEFSHERADALKPQVTWLISSHPERTKEGAADQLKRHFELLSDRPGRLSRAELLDLIAKHKIAPACYSFGEEPLPDDSVVLRHHPNSGTWSVTYFERGLHRPIDTFNNEEEANYILWRQLRPADAR
ncbi:MAG TPA: hypothetical protein VGI10_04315 [Polyangiaceae bacterium]